MSILLTIHKIQLVSLFLCSPAVVKFTWTTRANKLEISRRTQKQCSHTGHVGDPEQAFTSDGFPGALPACLKSVYITTHSQALALSQTSWVNTVCPSKSCSLKRTLTMLPCMCPQPGLYLNKGKSPPQSTHSWCCPNLTFLRWRRFWEPCFSTDETASWPWNWYQDCPTERTLCAFCAFRSHSQRASKGCLIHRPALAILPFQGIKKKSLNEIN